jgi:nicotinamidase-related amidase
MNDALLVIDVISDFEHEDGGTLLASFRDRLWAMQQVLARARAEGTPVIYVNDHHGRWDGDARGLVEEALGGHGGDVIAELAPRPGDPFLLKPRYSAFDHTALELLLRQLEIERVLLAGGATEACIVQSGVDARELGFKVTILSRACATVDPELEQISLRYASEVAGIHVE